MDYDVIVAGAGPAGSTCAAYLGKAGYNVLLLDKDKFPRDKACGDGIGVYATAILKKFGLLGTMSNYKRIRGFVISSPKGKVIRVPVTESLEGYTCPRVAFDNILFENAKKSAAVKERFMVRDILPDSAGVKGTDLESNEELEFHSKIIVAADGANSVIARKLGAAETDTAHNFVALRAYYENISGLTDFIELHFIREAVPGYFWIFPINESTANVGIGMITKYVIRNKVKLQELMFETIQKNPLFKKRFERAEIASEVKAWNLPMASKRRKCYFDNVLLAGDAAALIDPLTGEGISEAMLSGRLAALAIDKAFKKGDFSSATLKEYDLLIKKHMGFMSTRNYILRRMFMHHETTLNIAGSIGGMMWHNHGGNM